MESEHIMAAVNLKKPAAKPATSIKKPGGKAAAAKKPAAEKAPKPPKEIKPFEQGQIVIFKAYAQELAEGQEALFQPDQELAVVGQQETDGQVYVACVALGDYHNYLKDPESVAGQEVVPLEIKRTNRVVEPEYHMASIGELVTLQEEIPDPLELGLKLYGNAQQAFFYLGGVFGKLWKERDENGTLIFATYGRDENMPTENADGSALAGLTEENTYTQDSDGFALFLADNFPDVGGIRKVKELIGIYDTFSVLPNAEEVIGRLAEVGWWKAGMIRSYLTEDNASELVEAAATLTKKELETHLKTSYTTEGSDGGTTTASGKNTQRAVIKKITFTYALFEDQAEGAKLILSLAKKSTGITDDNALFEHIMQEWAGDHLGAEGVAKAEQAAAKETARLKKQGVKFPEGHKEYQPPAPKAAKEAKADAKPAAKAPVRPAAKPAAKPAAAEAAA
jgi:hypothetical protein